MEHLIKSQKNEPRITEGECHLRQRGSPVERMNTNFRSGQMQAGFSFVSIRVSWLKVFGSGYAGLGYKEAARKKQARAQQYRDQPETAAGIRGLHGFIHLIYFFIALNAFHGQLNTALSKFIQYLL